MSGACRGFLASQALFAHGWLAAGLPVAEIIAANPLPVKPFQAMADVEIVDPKPKIEKECHSSCTKPWTKYEACVKRITTKGSGTCEPWAFDYWACVDKCTAPRLFSVLK